MLPLLPAMWLFHRYSADKVKAAKTQSRRSPIAIVNQFLRPLTALCRPLYRLSAMLPGMAGQILADISLSLSISPFSLLAIIILIPAGLLAGLSVLPGVAICAAILWGILICDISTRDFSSAMEEMTGALSGGANRRYLRHLATSVGLGLLLLGAVLTRWAMVQPERALAMFCGILSLSALATFLGRSSRSPRTFLAIFLFAIYICLNEKSIAYIDFLGLMGNANLHSACLQLAIAAAATLFGYSYNRMQWRR